IAGYGEGAERPAVEAAVRGDDLQSGAVRIASPAVGAGGLDGALVGLRTAIGEEHPSGYANELDQPLGQPNAGLVDRQVRGVRQGHDLAAPGLDYRRVRGAEGGARDT